MGVRFPIVCVVALWKWLYAAFVPATFRDNYWSRMVSKQYWRYLTSFLRFPNNLVHILAYYYCLYCYPYFIPIFTPILNYILIKIYSLLGCVSKILTRFYETGSIRPGSIGGSKTKVSFFNLLLIVARSCKTFQYYWFKGKLSLFFNQLVVFPYFYLKLCAFEDCSLSAIF